MAERKKLANLKQPIEFGDLQLVATELDCSAKDLWALASDEITDGITQEGFDRLYKEIGENADHIVSFDDNSDMYEWEDKVLVLYDYLGRRAIIAERAAIVEAESLMDSYK